MGRPRIGTPEEAAARKRQQTAARVRRLRDKRRAEDPAPAMAATTSYSPSPYHAAKLAAFVERLERLEAELAGVAATRRRSPDLKDACAREAAAIKDELTDVWAELADSGFSVATTREILRLRKMDEDDRRDFETSVALYKQALGMD